MKKWALTIVGIALDQYTKIKAVERLSLFEAKTIIPKVLNFQLVYNYGAAYGILQHQRVFLTVIGCGVVIAILAGYKHIATTRFSTWGTHFILIGAVGNLIDRISAGYVVDFIDIGLFPVFNIADICIDVGIGCFLLDLWWTHKQSKAA